MKEKKGIGKEEARVIKKKLKDKLEEMDVIRIKGDSPYIVLKNIYAHIKIDKDKSVDVESRFWFCIYPESDHSDKVRLFLWGIEYSENPEIQKKWLKSPGSHLSNFDDDVRRIRWELDLNPDSNSVFEVNNGGEVCTKKSAPIKEINQLYRLYSEARAELKTLYSKTQIELDKLRNDSDYPRDIAYINADYQKYKSDIQIFQKYKDIADKLKIDVGRLSRDGIYPFYEDQKTKILVIGRTPYGLQEKDDNGKNSKAADYIETTYGHLQKGTDSNKTAGTIMKTIGKNLLPTISSEKDFFKHFGRRGTCGFSYAFINACPFNIQIDSSTDWPEYRKVMNEGSNILLDRIKNLEPDIIIALAIEGEQNGKKEARRVDYVKKNLGGILNQKKEFNDFKYIEVYSLKKYKNHPLIYLKYHPSCNKNWNECETEICKAVGYI